MWTGRSGRAFTLVELLVASVLTVLLLSLFFGFLVPAMRITGQQSSRAEIQQQGALAVRRIVAQLQTSTASAVALAADPVALSVAPLDEVDPNGKQIWKDHLWVVYWDTQSNRIVEKIWRSSDTPAYPITPVRPFKPTPEELKTIALTVNRTERVLATGVIMFRLDAAGGGPGVGMPLTVELTLARGTSQATEPENFRASRSVTLRQAAL